MNIIVLHTSPLVSHGRVQTDGLILYSVIFFAISWTMTEARCDLQMESKMAGVVLNVNVSASRF